MRGVPSTLRASRASSVQSHILLFMCQRRRKSKQKMPDVSSGDPRGFRRTTESRRGRWRDETCRCRGRISMVLRRQKWYKFSFIFVIHRWDLRKIKVWGTNIQEIKAKDTWTKDKSWGNKRTNKQTFFGFFSLTVFLRWLFLFSDFFPDKQKLMEE